MMMNKLCAFLETHQVQTKNILDNLKTLVNKWALTLKQNRFLLKKRCFWKKRTKISKRSINDLNRTFSIWWRKLISKVSRFSHWKKLFNNFKISTLLRFESLTFLKISKTMSINQHGFVISILELQLKSSMMIK